MQVLSRAPSTIKSSSSQAKDERLMRLVGLSGGLRAVRHAPRLVTDDLHMLHEGALQRLALSCCRPWRWREIWRPDD